MKMIHISIVKEQMIKLNLIPYDERLFDPDICKMLEKESYLTENGCEVTLEEFNSSVYGCMIDLFIKTDCISTAIHAAWEVMKRKDSDIENL